MRSILVVACRYSAILLLFFVAGQIHSSAQESIVPAGTLIHCTLDETNLSSATVAVGDPVLCHLSSLQEFGRTVFPRGSFLAGHLEADKEPGHFVGKGYLRLVFDRIGLPNTDVPVPAKVIFVRGFRVDREGDIVGHGHAKRDTAEWLVPPLWPWKIVSLPAKGPRPTLKREEQLTLRLMDDVLVPALAESRNMSGGSSRSMFDKSSSRPPFSPFGYWSPMETATGKVEIQTAMRGAGVYVDGFFAGTVDQLQMFKLRAGDHDIEVRATDGYSLYQDRIYVAAGKIVKINP